MQLFIVLLEPEVVVKGLCVRREYVRIFCVHPKKRLRILDEFCSLPLTPLSVTKVYGRKAHDVLGPVCKCFSFEPDPIFVVQARMTSEHVTIDSFTERPTIKDNVT